MNLPEKLLTADNPALRQRAKAMRQEMSEAKAKLWQHLRAGRLNGYKFRRQQPMGNYIVDFMCVTPKLIVEADGGQHTEQVAYDHTRGRHISTAWALPCCGFGITRFCSRQTTYWRKSCACCKNWKSSLHGSRWLILIGFLKIIGCRLPRLDVLKVV